jgi:hypothetical protein
MMRAQGYAQVRPARETLVDLFEWRCVLWHYKGTRAGQQFQGELKWIGNSCKPSKCYIRILIASRKRNGRTRYVSETDEHVMDAHILGRPLRPGPGSRGVQAGLPDPPHAEQPPDYPPHDKASKPEVWTNELAIRAHKFKLSASC